MTSRRTRNGVTLHRARFLALLASSTALAGCARIATSLTENDRLHRILDSPERLDLALLGSGQPLAREYSERAISPDFRHNGFDPPADAMYLEWMRNGWRGYRLFVTGLVAQPRSYGLDDLRTRFKPRAQITRHDCVEGWSVIGKWRGAQLRDVIAQAQPLAQARYAIFRCMDDDGSGAKYYESLDLHQASHPQALLAYELNDQPIPPKNGAPVRLTVPTQLGYKSAKHVQRIEVVAGLGGAYGRGGYWEDRDYEWFAGI